MSVRYWGKGMALEMCSHRRVGCSIFHDVFLESFQKNFPMNDVMVNGDVNDVIKYH